MPTTLPSAHDDVTLQVNVAPTDLPHAGTVLPHQLRQWSGQVREVLYTLDTRKSPGPRGSFFDERLPGMRALMEGLCAAEHDRRVLEVDYSDEARAEVGERFFGGRDVPLKDCFGAPFYAYFAGLDQAHTRYVLHVDGDMLFGGGSQSWIDEAVDLLRGRDEVLLCSPLAGPPTADGRLSAAVRRRQRTTQLFGSAPELECQMPRAYRLRHATSRIFLIDLERLEESVGALAVLAAPTWTHGSNLAETPFLPAETVLSRAMRSCDLLRVDYLGRGSGMWFLHPPHRSEQFYRDLPDVVRRIESGEVPEAQRGDSEVGDALVDWTSVRRERPRRSANHRVIAATGIPAAVATIRRWKWTRRMAAGTGGRRPLP
jgi:hypothetical protein